MWLRECVSTNTLYSKWWNALVGSLWIIFISSEIFIDTLDVNVSEIVEWIWKWHSIGGLITELEFWGFPLVGAANVTNQFMMLIAMNSLRSQHAYDSIDIYVSIIFRFEWHIQWFSNFLEGGTLKGAELIKMIKRQLVCFILLETLRQCVWYNRFLFNLNRSVLSWIHWVTDTL